MQAAAKEKFRIPYQINPSSAEHTNINWKEKEVFLLNMMEAHPMNHLNIGRKAPDFTANTTFGPIQFTDYKGKRAVFFSHPGDFTPAIIN